MWTGPGKHPDRPGSLTGRYLLTSQWNTQSAPSTRISLPGCCSLVFIRRIGSEKKHRHLKKPIRACANRRFTADPVEAIRQAYWIYGQTQASLAEICGFSQVTINRVVHRKVYANALRPTGPKTREGSD